jgi:hypothetical protein
MFDDNGSRLRLTRAMIRSRAKGAAAPGAAGAKALDATGRRLVHRMNVVGGLMKVLDRKLTAAAVGCACGGAEWCRPCAYDRAAPLIKTIMSEARRYTELRKSLDQLEDLRQLSYSVKSLCGGGGGDTGPSEAEADLHRQLDDARGKHDAALEALCNRKTGVMPDHPLCEGYCAATNKTPAMAAAR